ncbi:hypothetical protein J3R82DRAFT_6502 [Butyriboletus roseoflavus]|nr:hypothetical protein J3R82DRAFT_6502 [Butyriboletus roseoflavus]
MLLLTQSTLFFRDLALNTRAQKVSLDCEVEKWTAGVEAAETPASSAPTTISLAFHLAAPPTLGTSALTKSTAPTSVSKQSEELPPQLTNSPVNEDLDPENFGADVDEVDERAQSVSYHSRPSSVGEVCTTPTLDYHCTYLGLFQFMAPNSDGKQDGIPASLAAYIHTTSSGASKRKASLHEDSESEPDGNEPEMVAVDNPMIVSSRTTPSTSLGIVRKSQPPPKKTKLGDTEMAALTTEPDASSSFSQVTTAPVLASGTQYNQDGYIVEIIKKKYTVKDLPVPGNDNRCPNPWVIPEEKLAAAIQVVWDIVFPEIKYRVALDGSVMSIMQHRLSEWRSGIGSTAISMMISFFMTIDDVDVPATAEALFENYGYLRADPADMEKGSVLRSHFLIQLLGTAHLNNIVGYVNVPEWGTGHLAAGKDMAGVVGMAAAAVMFRSLAADI